jgi:hypothetical protein
LRFVLESRIAHHVFLTNLYLTVLSRYGRPAGIFKCRTFHVQRRIMERQFHNIVSVPRVFGPETKFVCVGGSVQFGWKVEAATARSRITKLTARPAKIDERGIVAR